MGKKHSALECFFFHANAPFPSRRELSPFIPKRNFKRSIICLSAPVLSNHPLAHLRWPIPSSTPARRSAKKERVSNFFFFLFPLFLSLSFSLHFFPSLLQRSLTRLSRLSERREREREREREGGKNWVTTVFSRTSAAIQHLLNDILNATPRSREIDWNINFSRSMSSSRMLLFVPSCAKVNLLWKFDC